MATRESGGQSHAQRPAEEVDETVAEPVDAADVQERHDALTDDVDALLDEIDDVLEENAEDFIKAFVQKGGQ
jgi:prokaryotic ubiquitin-like protein Pup